MTDDDYSAPHAELAVRVLEGAAALIEWPGWTNGGHLDSVGCCAVSAIRNVNGRAVDKEMHRAGHRGPVPAAAHGT